MHAAAVHDYDAIYRRANLYIHTVKAQGLLQPFMVISVAMYMLRSLSVLHFSCNYLER